MDFFSLLKNKPKVDETLEPPKVETPKIEIRLSKSKEKIIVDECQIEDEEKTVTNCKKETTPLFNLEEIEFKKGDTVRVIRLENSSLNHYKGYNGVIRDSQKDSASCMVLLEALNYGAAIKFPKTHLIKWCQYTNTQI
jgi:hypothetical protein